MRPSDRPPRVVRLRLQTGHHQPDHESEVTPHRHVLAVWHLQEADAQDVTQTVLLKLAEQMRTFTYDPGRSFRAYLKTLTHRAWCNFLESRRRLGVGSGDSAVLEVLQTIAAREDLVERLNEEFDRELLDEAMARVRERVEAHTWEAFCLTVLEGLSGAAVGERLGLKVATVFKAKSKVQKCFRRKSAGWSNPYSSASRSA